MCHEALSDMLFRCQDYPFQPQRVVDLYYAVRGLSQSEFMRRKVECGKYQCVIHAEVVEVYKKRN